MKIDVVESEEEGKRDEEFSGLDAVFHTEACAFDKDDFGVVEKAVEDGGGNGAVAVEDGEQETAPYQGRASRSRG